jgi:hypothetical protein
MIPQANPVRGFLASVGLQPRVLVKFQYNPTQLSDKRAVSYASLTAPGLLLPVRQYIQGGDRTISFTVRIDGLFDGPADDEIDISKDDDGSIAPELDKYRAFLYPRNARWKEASEQGFVPLYASAPQQFVSPPTCRFGFGNRPVLDCVVTEVSITELLFNSRLGPLRADVAVTLVELSPYGNEPTPPPG